MLSSNGKWSRERLEKLRTHYEHLLQQAIIANAEERKRLSGITRRARKRLARFGITMLDQPGGKARYIQPKPPLVANEDLELTRAKKIVSYVNNHHLIYGTTHDHNPSWAISLNTYRLNATVGAYLRHDLPKIIAEYALNSANLIKRALCEPSSSTTDMLLYGVPASVRQLWQKFTASRSYLPCCFRPDLLLETSGNIKAIEFNVDSRLDRGIAYGVSSYSTGLLEPQAEVFLANNLTRAYAQLARSSTRLDVPRIATLFNPNCRPEYMWQEDFFAKAIAVNEGISWRLLSMDQVIIDELSGFLVERDSGQHLDAVVMELELLNNNASPRHEECNFIESVLCKCPKTHILGSILPFADKLLLALASTSAVGDHDLQSGLMPTWIVGDEKAPITVNDLKRCHMLNQHFVLKRTGIHLDSTGSKGVIICSDVSSETWSRAVDQAFDDVQTGQRGWVIQPRAEPEPYLVRYKLTPQGRTREDNCFVRLSAFYLLDDTTWDNVTKPDYYLAGAIATAGTDEEMLKKHLYTIRALRQSTYMAVTIASY